MNFAVLLATLRTYSVQGTLVLTALSSFLLANPAIIEMVPRWVLPSVTAAIGLLTWIGRTIPQPEATAAIAQARSQ